MKTTLVIMAAGLGSRYGGNKQVDVVGPNNEILMEWSTLSMMPSELASTKSCSSSNPKWRS